jgi:putative endonuclease
MNKQPAVYILASRPNGTLYTGVTSDLVKRVWQHKSNLVAGFTKKYAVHMLVYYELCDDMLSAIAREKQIKAGSRSDKIELVQSVNASWRDLYDQIVGQEGT